LRWGLAAGFLVAGRVAAFLRAAGLLGFLVAFFFTGK
jgi:hypothetical protein